MSDIVYFIVAIACRIAQNERGIRSRDQSSQRKSRQNLHSHAAFPDETGRIAACFPNEYGATQGIRRSARSAPQCLHSQYDDLTELRSLQEQHHAQWKTRIGEKQK